MHLTPDILEATYDWLRALPPFRQWRLPPGDEVVFRVLGTKKLSAQHYFDGERHTIDMSAAKVAHTTSIVVLMAHEMCHVRANVLGERAEHGPVFESAARQVCRHHGFDPKEF